MKVVSVLAVMSASAELVVPKATQYPIPTEGLYPGPSSGQHGNGCSVDAHHAIEPADSWFSANSWQACFGYCDRDPDCYSVSWKIQEGSIHNCFLDRRKEGYLCCNNGAGYHGAFKTTAGTGCPSSDNDRCQCDAAAPTPEQQEEFLRQHNVRRCMHGAPPLQLSSALADEAQKVLDENKGKNKKRKEPQGGGFKQVGSSFTGCTPDVHFGEGCSAKEETPVWDIVDEWYTREIQRTGNPDEGTTSNTCGTPEDGDMWKQCAEYTQMLWQSTTHVGCGVWQGDDQWTVMCYYGPKGNHQGDFEKEVLPVNNNKTFDDCKREVANWMDFKREAQNKKVIIAYTPDDGQAAVLSSALTTSKPPGCDPPAEYRLVVREKELRLVPVNDKHQSCAPDHYPDEKVNDPKELWEFNYDSVFRPNKKNENKCLFAEFGGELSGNDKDAIGCALNNAMQDPGEKSPSQKDPPSVSGHWVLQRSVEEGDQLCMMDVPDEVQQDRNVIQVHGISLITSLKKNLDLCSKKWKMTVFKPPLDSTLQSNLSQQPTLGDMTCDQCRSRIGNFACARGEKCELAPTKIACTAQGGTWCAPPLPEYRECAEGQDDWGAREAGQPERRECSAGCDYNICDQKMKTNDAEGHQLARWHCWVKGQNKNDIPRGCDYGSPENTCAWNGTDCVYSDLGSSMIV